MADRIDRADPRVSQARKVEKLARKILLDESARAAVLAFAGAGEDDQRAERIEYLLSNGRDVLVEILGADAAHPSLAALSKDTGYRLEQSRETSKGRAEKAFAAIGVGG